MTIIPSYLTTYNTLKQHDPSENIILYKNNDIIIPSLLSSSEFSPQIVAQYSPNHPKRRFYTKINNYLYNIYNRSLSFNKNNSIINGRRYLLTDAAKHHEVLKQNLTKIIADLRNVANRFYDNIDSRCSTDIFGNMKIFQPKNLYRNNQIDPCAALSINGSKYEFETDINALAYRELISHTLKKPTNKIQSLSTPNYGVYEAHDHTTQQPHLLIIPKHKKYKNFIDMLKNGTESEIEEYLIITRKIANICNPNGKIYPELFITDSGSHQKVPFFYAEYLPNAVGETMPDRAKPYHVLWSTKIT